MGHKTQLKKAPLIIVGIALLLVVTAFFVVAPGDEAPSGMLVFTQIPSASVDGKGIWDWKYPEGSRIVGMDLNDPSGEIKILTKDFFAARAPEVSFDGKRLLFSGKKQAEDPWEIWEVEISGGSLRKMSKDLKDCTDPAYLPADDGIVFSARVPDEEDVFALYTTRLDGCCLDRITHHPGVDFSSSILSDGRILYTSAAPPSPSMLSTTIYDGTKAELYYKNSDSTWYGSRARETALNEIVFIESTAPDQIGGSLLAISNKRPLHSRRQLASELEGQFHSLYPTGTNELVVSYRSSVAKPFGLHRLDMVTGQLDTPLGKEEVSFHAVEPVLAIRRERLLAFPSLVDKSQPVGWLFCLDANHSTYPSTQADKPSGTRIQVFGKEGLLGEAPLETDGSFNLKIPADTPVRLVTVDEEGSVIRGPSAWIWVRPNEQRGCVGCHENRELAPPNVLPLAITKPCTPIGVDSTKMRMEAAGEDHGM